MSVSSEPVPLRLGPYDLVHRIATGGMAEVYLARRAGPHGFEKQVALKRILPQFVKDPDFVAMFVDEARVCARLSHPNIVQVFDFGEHESDLYMAMEFVDGTTAGKLIRAAASRGEEIPLDVSIYVVLSILRGLEYAHSARDDGGKSLGLVHRDVSPGNLLIDRSGAVKLSDFGIARAAEFERRTDVGQLKGKLGYMSPEQVLGKELDPRSDLFTLAIVFAEMMILKPLFGGGRELDVLMRIRDADVGAIDRAGHRVPDDVRAVLLRALARDPFLRYPNATAFATALEDIVRRRRLQIGPSKLVSWLEKLDLVAQDDADDDLSETGRRSTAVFDVAGAGLSSRRDGRNSSSLPPSDRRDVAPAIYRVQFADGTELGPMSYPTIVEMFVTGNMGRGALVARESSRFKKASEYSELQRYVQSPALRWDDEWSKEVRERGLIDRTTFPSHLYERALRRDTGVVLLRDGSRQKKVYLVDGVPEFVASTLKQELLGEFLIGRGQVLRMEVEMALAVSPRFGGRLGDALVGLGILRSAELFRAIFDQTLARYLDVFRWHRGEVGFVKGARSHEETFPLGFDPFDLIARGIRDYYSGGELEAMLSPLQNEVLEPEPHPPVRLETFRFVERELRILRTVDGRLTLRAIVAAMRASGTAESDLVYRTIFLGLSCRLLKCSAWSARLAQSV